jgi:hypothetical protein
MKSEEENKEWLNEYMSLKQVNPQNPFTVPSGYFNAFEERISSAIFLEMLKEENALHRGFTVPENYFDELSGNIQSRIAVEEALNGANTGFKVPENYFDTLQQQIESRITVEKVLAKKPEAFSMPDDYFATLQQQIQSRIAVEEVLAKKPEAFSVPDDYFATLQQQIQSRIAVEEVLSEKTQAFSVPETYFDELNKNIISKTTGTEQKRSALVRRLYTSVAFKYATAACIILMVGAGFFIKKTEAPTPVEVHKSSYLHTELKEIPDADIENYLDLHLDASDTQTLIENADTEDLQNL